MGLRTPMPNGAVFLLFDVPSNPVADIYNHMR